MEKASEELISIIIIATIIIISLAVFTFLFFLLFVRKKRKLQREAQKMKAEFEQQLLQAQMETREETLNQLGIELHDNVGQLLNSTKLLIGITQRMVPNAPDTLVTADETLAKAIQELRALSKSLNKEWLNQFNFVQNLGAEVSRINSAKDIYIDLTCPEKISLQANEQIILFRIVQELLQNAIKHARARNIHILITEKEPQLNLTVIDDGLGFDTKASLKGVGILNVKHRTRLLGGQAEWQTSETGTTVIIRIPKKQQ